MFGQNVGARKVKGVRLTFDPPRDDFGAVVMGFLGFWPIFHPPD